MALYKKLDIWSISDGLDRMMDYCYNSNGKNSPYWDHYYDQINELCNMAADLYNELQDVKSRLWCQMPVKKISFYDEDDCSQTATAWFNTAAAMLHDTDMTELLEYENIYCADEWAEKQKRISALNRLTKQQQMFLYTEVIGLITRYLELSAAFETIEAVITELDYHQSAIKGNGGITLPQTAYV